MSLPSGKSFPKIGLGTYKAGTLVNSSVLNALEVGYRLIDSAALYGNEVEVSATIAKFLQTKLGNVKRDDIIYTTKLWENGYDNAEEGIAKSLENAAIINHIDLYLIHSPKGGPQVRRETWRSLQEAVELGKLRDVGVSNWGIKHLEELFAWDGLTVKPAVNQIEVNPWFQQNELIEYCKSKGIIVEVYSPLMRGNRLDDPELVSLAKKYKKTVAQILLAWNIARGTTPIPKSTSSEERVKENFEALDFQLDPEDVKNLGDPNSRYVTQSGWDPTTWD